MADYEFIQTSGLVVPDTGDLKSDVEGEFKTAFGEDFVIVPESPEGVLIAGETEARDGIVRNNAELANQINPHYAGGVFLDAICALTGLERRSAVSSIVKAQLAGVPGTIIPAGVRAATTSGDIFISQSNLVLNGSGSGEVWFYSEVKDSVPAPAGSLTEILDYVLGWETITNNAPAVLGQPVESDSDLRKRREQTLYLQGVALPGAIMSAVMDVPGVRSMIFRENYTSEIQEIDGVLIPAHSIYCVVDGGTDEDVAQALFENKSLGCGWEGTVEVTVTDPVSGQPYLVRFDRPEYVPVRARVTARVLGSATIDMQNIIRDAIVDYADGNIDGQHGFVVGASVSPFEMAGAVNIVEPGIFVTSIVTGRLSDDVEDLKAETMPLEIWQKATITAGSIDVVAG